MKTNSLRIEFLRAFYRLKTPDQLDVSIFEALQDAFFSANGSYVYKDFAAFRASKAHYIRNKKDIIGGKIAINRPKINDHHIICPSCRAKLELK